MGGELLVEVCFPEETHLPIELSGHRRAILLTCKPVYSRLHLSALQKKIMQVKLDFSHHIVGCQTVRIP